MCSSDLHCQLRVNAVSQNAFVIEFSTARCSLCCGLALDVGAFSALPLDARGKAIHVCLALSPGLEKDIRAQISVLDIAVEPPSIFCMVSQGIGLAARVSLIEFAALPTDS